jgi:hypothetical protein
MYVVAAWVLIACACGSGGRSPEVTGTELDAVVLDASDCTGVIEQSEPDRQVISDAESFRTAFLRTHQDGVEVPAVDFENYSVIAVYRGRRKCGSTIGVKSVREDVDGVTITVLTRDACGGDDSLAWPFSFVQIPRVAKPHSFLELSEPGKLCD